MRRSVARLTAVLLGSVAVSASALGFGQMTVDSGLGQPLRARIPLQGVAGHDLDGVHVTIPSTSVFHRAGVAHAGYLREIKVKVVSNGGHPYIRLRTTKPFRTPYLDLLLQIRVPGERMVREFTALINPPGAAPANPSPSSSQGQPTLTAGASPQSAGQGSNVARAATYGPVRHNETLWSIATKLHGSHDVTVYQMLDGLYRKNPDAFGGSVNSLHAGVELHIPSDQYLQSINPQNAKVVAVRHMRTSRSANRGKLQLVATSTSAHGSHSTSASTSAAGSSRGASSGLLHLSASVLASLEQRALQSTGNPFHASPLPSNGNARSANATATSGSPSAVSTARQPGASAAPGTASGAPSSTGTGSTIANGGSAPASVKASGAAATTQAVSKPSGQTPAHSGSSTGANTVTTSSNTKSAGAKAAHVKPSAADHGVAQATAKAEPAATTKPRASESFLGEWSSLLRPLLSNRMALLGVLLLLLLLFLVARRRRKSQKWVDTLDESLSGIETPAAEAASDAGSGIHTFVGAASTIEQATSGDDEQEVAEGDPEPTSDQSKDSRPSASKAPPATVADAIADAEFNMTYGLYDEALIALRQPELGYPKDRTLRLKELEVLFAAGRTDEFVSLARGVRPELARSDLSAWRRIAHMGQTLLPGDPLFNPWIEEAESGEPPDATIGDPDETQDTSLNTEQGGIDGVDESADADPARAATAAVEADAQAILSSETGTDTTQPASQADEERHTIDFDLGDFDEGGAGSQPSSTDDTLGMPAIDFDPAAFDWSGDGESGTGDKAAGSSVDDNLQEPELPQAEELSQAKELPAGEDGAQQDTGSAPADDDWRNWGLADAVEQPQQPASGDGYAGQGSSTGIGASESDDAEGPTQAPAAQASTEDNVDGDDVDIKLSLARAYVEMGEKDMAQSLIAEVAIQGSAIQKQQADALRELLG